MMVHPRRGRARLLSLVTALIAAFAILPLSGSGERAFAGPIADSEVAYQLCGRVFPDPQAYWVPAIEEATPHPGTGTSPFAKGNAECAARTFISYDEAIRGMRFLADVLPGTKDFVEVIDVTTTDDPRITEVLNEELGDGWSEGLQGADDLPEQVPLYLVKVTAPDGWDYDQDDDVAPIAEADRDHFVWSLSIHGIERAGVEGGVRAIEDLATWGANEPTRSLLETYDGSTIDTIDGAVARNLPVGEVLMRSVSYFVFPNPDGWRRGDVDQARPAFMRFNGNGMDNNRDWPEIGWTEAGFSPWSESETRTYGKVLKNLTDNWTGGIDLHGMVVANAFSYTLVGGSQRPFGKNERVMQFVEQAWDDAERRLLWSPQIKPNDAPEQCATFAGVAPDGETHLPPEEDCDQRPYGVQYGTIWDTIEYTVTGAMGNWIDSPVGLNADGIDNEMMMSHLGNCGSGTCYLPEYEQLHVDGNKSLIYAMLNFSLQPPEATFDLGSDVAYLVNPRRLVDPGIEQPTPPEGAVAPDDSALKGSAAAVEETTLAEWTIDNATGDTYVGGITADIRWVDARGLSHGDLATARIEYFDEQLGQWTRRPIYKGGIVYQTPGMASYWNYPEDGEYRLQLTGGVPIVGDVPVEVQWDVDLTVSPAWEQPLQRPFDASNMDFFAELEPFLGPETTLTALDVDRVLAAERDLGDFDTVVVADDAALPGFDQGAPGTSQGLQDLPPTGYTSADRDLMGSRMADFVAGGGNLVLSDNALQALAWMGLVDASDIGSGGVYAGHVAFKTADAATTYDDPLAAGIDRPGAAEGLDRRRQIVEPVPLGYPLSNVQPQWYVDAAAVTAAGGRIVGTEQDGSDRVTLAELAHGDGVVRILGSFLPFPTTQAYHPFGLSSYAVTDNGYILAQNLWRWDNPGQNPQPDLTDDEITWISSGIPTRIGVDGRPLAR